MLSAAALLLALSPGAAVHAQSTSGWPAYTQPHNAPPPERDSRGSALVEQVAPQPLAPDSGPGQPAGEPEAGYSGRRAGEAHGRDTEPPRRSPELTRQRQLTGSGGPESDRSVVLDQDAVSPRLPDAGVAVIEPKHRPADRTQAKPLAETVEHQKSQTKGLVTQPGHKLVGSAQEALGQPKPEFTPPKEQTPAPKKEVTPPKSGAETAGRPVAIDCRNRQTAPGQPEAHLTPPDRCANSAPTADPDLASQRLGQDTASSPPKFSGDAAAIGLVPGATTPNTIGANNPFLLPSGPGVEGGAFTADGLPPTLGGGRAGGR